MFSDGDLITKIVYKRVLYEIKYEKIRYVFKTIMYAGRTLPHGYGIRLESWQPKLFGNRFCWRVSCDAACGRIYHSAMIIIFENNKYVQKS